MANKKSLIVDDSKSARTVLKSMLDSFGLDVVTVESAADAIKYLQQYRPDVIFMDHMMPEMDGFEAVKLIKDNPQTAVIPIIMYTSKAGDVYLSKARELGAVGIISKTISPVGLKETLFKLGLVDSEKIESSLQKKPVANKNANTATTNHVNIKNNRELLIRDIQRSIDEQTIELHKSMWLGIESVSNEIFNKLKTEHKEELERQQQVSKHENKTRPWTLYFITFLLALASIFSIQLFNQNLQLKNSLATINKQAESNFEKTKTVEQTTLITQPSDENKKARFNFIIGVHNQSIAYPYNELAFNENRLSTLQTIINQALHVGYRGKIILHAHIGEFCYARDKIGNYVLADDESSVSGCDYIGNIAQPSDAPFIYQSMDFVNFLSDMTQLTEDGVVIEVKNMHRVFDVAQYPEKAIQTKAKDWNSAAQQNNRVTIKLEPVAVD